MHSYMRNVTNLEQKRIQNVLTVLADFVYETATGIW